MADEIRQGTNGYFNVVIDEYDDVTFQSCDGLEGEIEVVYVPEGGRGHAPRATRGAPRTNKIRFSHGSISRQGKKGLFQWFQDVCDYSKPLKRQTLTVQLLDSANDPVRSWKILDAWPCRWVGPVLTRDASGLPIEVIEFAHEGITN